MSSETDGGPTNVMLREPALPILTADLTVVDGPDRGRRARIATGIGRIGTARTNHLVLPPRPS